MILAGDCLEVLPTLAENSVDLIFTSPPYAMQRKSTYGGIPESEYVDWFSNVAKQLWRVLKPTGSFFVNLKPHSVDYRRVFYVWETVMMLDKTGWFFIDEICWVKNAVPGHFYPKFKNAFEPIYHFTKGHPRQVKFNPLACATPTQQKSFDRLKRGRSSYDSQNGSGFSTPKTLAALARPTNVIHVKSNSIRGLDNKLRQHPAFFPIELVDFFVKSYTDEGDTVLDPFAGSGTVGLSCKQQNRQYILIERNPEYVKMIHNIMVDK